MCCWVRRKMPEIMQPVTETCLVQARSAGSRAAISAASPAYPVPDSWIACRGEDRFRRYVSHRGAGGRLRISAVVGWEDYWLTATGGMTWRRADADTVRWGRRITSHGGFPVRRAALRDGLAAAARWRPVRFIAYEVDPATASQSIVFYEEVTIADGRSK